MPTWLFCFLSFYFDADPEGQKGTGFRIPDPDPQHCCNSFLFKYIEKIAAFLEISATSTSSLEGVVISNFQTNSGNVWFIKILQTS